jgi:hypothetical protein
VVAYRILWAAFVTLALTALASHWLRRRRRGDGPGGVGSGDLGAPGEDLRDAPRSR